MPLLAAGDLSMYYEVHGEGEPLVLILGLALDVSECEALIAGLAASFRVIAFDNRGAGRTDQPPGPYSIPMMAADTLALMDALELPRARVVGVSMGSRVAIELAWAHPQRVRDLVLVSTGYRARGRLTLSWPSRLASLVKWLPLFASDFPQSRHAYAAQLDATMSYDCGDKLSALLCPTLIAQGRRDRSAPFADAVEMSRRIPRATLAPFRGGHLFFLFRERQRLVDLVANF